MINQENNRLLYTKLCYSCSKSIHERICYSVSLVRIMDGRDKTAYYKNVTIGPQQGNPTLEIGFCEDCWEEKIAGSEYSFKKEYIGFT